MERKKAVIIGRVSTLKQRQMGISLDEIQIPKIKEYFERLGYEVDKVFEFNETADRKQRKEFNRAIEYIKNNEDVIAVGANKVDRTTRNYRDAEVMDQLRCEYGKELHFLADEMVITKESRGELIAKWDNKIYQAKQLINNLQGYAEETILTKHKQGKILNNSPLGYKNITLENGEKDVVVVPSEARIIKAMYEWYASGAYSLNQIVSKLKEEFNIDMKKASVEYKLKNKFYHGFKRYRGGWHPHVYEKIITKDLYDEVQEVFNGFHKKHYKYAGIPHSYIGVLKCEHCGCAITAEIQKDITYYHCTQYHGKHGAKYIPEDILTKQFVNIFDSIEIPDDDLEWLVQEINGLESSVKDNHDTLLTNLNADYKKYEVRIEKMYEDYLDERITQDLYDKKRKEYLQEQENIKEKIKNLEAYEEEYFASAKYLCELVNHASELFVGSIADEKRELLKLVLSNPSIEGEKLLPKLESPFDTMQVCKSRQNWLLR